MIIKMSNTKHTVNELIRIFFLGAAQVNNILRIVNATPTNAIKVTQNDDAGSSTSTGGAVNITNTLNDGAGLVIFSAHAGSANGTLLAVRASNTAFDQKAVNVDYSGVSHAALIESKNASAGASSNTLAVVSANTLGSAMGVTGVEEDHGTLKIVHTKPTNSDANAAAISIELDGTGTACQGIYINSLEATGTTGDLLDFRKNSGASKLFGVDANGQLLGRSKAGDPDATDISASHWGLWKNTSSGAVKLWYNDAGSLKSVTLT